MASNEPTTHNITAQDIEKLASLSRLKVSDEEKIKYAKEIDSILAYVDQIQVVTADTVIQTKKSPTQFPHRNILRDDSATPLETDRKKLIESAPESQDGYIKVKKILK